MKRRMTALLTALLLALTLCVPALAVTEYGAYYDETDQLGSVELTAYVYENSGYGCGESKDGVSLTLLLRSTADGAYTLAEKDWCVYSFLDETRGSAQELSDVVRDAVSPYMAERAWNGRDMTMSATALSQAVDAMAESVENYIHANASTDVAGEDTEAVAGEGTETQTQEPTDADMNYIFDLSDKLTFDEWAELEAQARSGQPISLMDLADAVHREERDKKKSVMEQLRQSPKQERKKTAPKKSAEREI